MKPKQNLGEFRDRVDYISLNCKDCKHNKVEGVTPCNICITSESIQIRELVALTTGESHLDKFRCLRYLEDTVGKPAVEGRQWIMLCWAYADILHKEKGPLPTKICRKMKEFFTFCIQQHAKSLLELHQIMVMIDHTGKFGPLGKEIVNKDWKISSEFCTLEKVILSKAKNFPLVEEIKTLNQIGATAYGSEPVKRSPISYFYPNLRPVKLIKPVIVVRTVPMSACQAKPKMADHTTPHPFLEAMRRATEMMFAQAQRGRKGKPEAVVRTCSLPPYVSPTSPSLWVKPSTKPPWDNPNSQHPWGNPNSQPGWGNSNSQWSWGNQNSKTSWGNPNSQWSWGNQNSKTSWGNPNSQWSWGNQNSKTSWGNPNSQWSWGNQNSKTSWGNPNSQWSWGNQNSKTSWGNPNSQWPWGNSNSHQPGINSTSMHPAAKTTSLPPPVQPTSIPPYVKPTLLPARINSPTSRPRHFKSNSQPPQFYPPIKNNSSTVPNKTKGNKLDKPEPEFTRVVKLEKDREDQISNETEAKLQDEGVSIDPLSSLKEEDKPDLRTEEKRQSSHLRVPGAHDEPDVIRSGKSEKSDLMGSAEEPNVGPVPSPLDPDILLYVTDPRTTIRLNPSLFPSEGGGWLASSLLPSEVRKRPEKRDDNLDQRQSPPLPVLPMVPAGCKETLLGIDFTPEEYLEHTIADNYYAQGIKLVEGVRRVVFYHRVNSLSCPLEDDAFFGKSIPK
ncbi:uncharacterized protein LOC118438831 [Folsomia candida]|uniref:Paternally-expressed gene 3 protein n=1 Tax=Folsomia candida TaxID=158441 RepID=A0A226DA68_FOLCA|nr:uncharacterized protein LOC118438831 [Folsomia candida]OXA42030.1 Paternally-expressed gene 3 protein [Folsomia candida]